MRRLYSATLFALTLLVAAPALARAQDMTVIVVRHAERLDRSSDSPLSEVGRARADALAGALADAGVDAIYVTQYTRTRATAEPLARKLGHEPRVVEAGGDARAHATAVAERVRAEQAGRVVLVVGHSNTAPAIVTALTGIDVEDIADTEHDHFFIVLVRPDGGHLIRAGYPPRR